MDEQEAYDQSIAFEPATTMDAHLGDGLFRLCAWVHFFVAAADGWLEPREEDQKLTPEQLWKGVSAKEVFSWATLKDEIIGEGKSPHPFQASITQGEKQWRLFAPSGEKSASFSHSIARINSAPERPTDNFPRQCFAGGIDLRGASLVGARLDGASLVGAILDRASLDRAILVGASLVGARLVGAILDGASLDRARLDGASLVGARLDRALGLTWKQIDSAWIDEWTRLPEKFEELRMQKLERQQRASEKDAIELEEGSEADHEDADVELNE